MTKKELDQLISLKAERKMWIKQLIELRCGSFIKGQEVTGMPFVSGTSDKTASMAINMTEKERLIEDNIRQCEELEVKILDYIKSISDSQVRQAINYHYVLGYSWQQTAMSMRIVSKSTVKMMVDRYLREV